MKYDTLNTDSQMVSEPTAFDSVRVGTERSPIFNATHASNEDSFDADNAPCQFTTEEVKQVLAQNRIDYCAGHYHTNEEINRMMDEWC